VLTPAGAALPKAPDLLQALENFGAIVLEMSPNEHDAALALTSHLPQLASTALAATLRRSGNPYAARIFGNGLLDMTRLALSSPDLWSGILATNKAEVGNAIDSYIEVLKEIKRTLGEREMADTFEQGTALARSIRKLPLTK
jgi:prephenate dehydrogenase